MTSDVTEQSAVSVCQAPNGSSPAQASHHLMAALETSDVVHFIPDERPDDLRAYYDELVEALGTPIDIAEDYAAGGAPTGDRWSEIRYRDDIPDLAAFRHSKNAQPLHTDESYVSTEVGVMLFYCTKPAASGGETVFVSGPDLVAHLAVDAPDMLQRLLRTDVVYQKAGDSKVRPIIAGTADRPTFNFNYFCVEPDQPAEAVALNEEFHRYLEDRLPQRLIVPVAMEAGDGIAWKDHLVLHGRNAFAATKTGDREIWKTGVVLSSHDG